jgi:hypothetical protein
MKALASRPKIMAVLFTCSFLPTLWFLVGQRDVATAEAIEAGPGTPPGQGLPEGKDAEQRLQPYLQVLRQQGREPVRFVTEALARHDLIIFDDVLHTALEPFEFYQQLIRDEAFQRQAPAIFLEIISINRQRYLDAYLNAPSDDPLLLNPAFQDELNGNGWGLRSYFDLMQAVRVVNQALPPKSRLRVYGVNSPTLWPEIQTRHDLVQFRKSTASRDHHMYMAILNELAEFRGKRKGIFLTNTRHAYKGIRRKDGQFFWNAATFFHQWHPGKAYSIRIHNVAQQAVRTFPAAPSGRHMHQPTHAIKCVRMARGLWDSAFRAAGDRPVAFPLQRNVFGEEEFIGPDQLDAMPNQTLHDAYDAVVFLAPLEKLRQSGTVDFIYTPAFMTELRRRMGIMYTEAQLAPVLKKTQVKDLDGLFVLLRKQVAAQPPRPLAQVQEVGPIDEWKSRPKD